MKRLILNGLLAFSLILWAPKGTAQTLLGGNHSIDGKLCVGLACTGSESFDGDVAIRIKQTLAGLKFEDSSGPTHPSGDWGIYVNDAEPGGLNKFMIRDVDLARTPFTILSGAPEDTLFMSSAGRIGMGTSLPQGSLHVLDPNLAEIILEKSGAGSWNINSGDVGLFVTDQNTTGYPFVIENGAPSETIWIEKTGKIGLGTNAPEGKLHTKGDGVQLAYFESGDGGAVQVRFRTDSQNRRFLATNNADEVQTQMQFRDNEILFLGATVAEEWLKVDASGITTAGPTCNPNPCDATFDPNAFEVPAIKERAALMWEQKHLPAIGPTTPGEAINLTEKTGGIIHELEVAHIYIEQLHDRLKMQEAQLQGIQALHAMQMEDVLSRLDLLEMQP